MGSLTSHTWFDAHAHLQESQIVHDLPGMMKRWQAMGGCEIVCCGIHEGDWATVGEISQALPLLVSETRASEPSPSIGGNNGPINEISILPCIGLHPWFVHQASPHWEKALETVLDQTPNVVGIGEIGLDFVLKHLDRGLQERVFLSQLVMAKERGLPVSIHVRKAWDRLLQILKKVGALPRGGLIHSYSGSAEMVPQLEKRGLYISFSGSVTHLQNRKARRALTVVSPDRLLIETDSPAILPRHPVMKSDGGGRHVMGGSSALFSRWKPGGADMGGDVSLLYTKGWNEPANLWMTALSVSETLGISLAHLARLTRKNGLRLFDQRI